MIFARSDWLLKLGIASAIRLPAFFWISRDFSLISQKKRTIRCWLSTGLVYAKTIIHLSISDESVVDFFLTASRLSIYPPLFSSKFGE